MVGSRGCSSRVGAVGVGVVGSRDRGGESRGGGQEIFGDRG